jgi:hypothetical protein
MGRACIPPRSNPLIERTERKGTDMTKPHKLPLPKTGLSLACILNDARYIDWGALREDGDEPYELQLPTPTYGEWDEYGDCPENVARIAKRTPHKALSDAHHSAFAATDAYYEWRDGFEPMMNYGWPVELAYDVDLADAVQRMAEFAGTCTLVDMGEGSFGGSREYVIALSGGGMNLADQLAAAYLCCGCVPPVRLLEQLPGVISEGLAERLPLAKAFAEARDYLANKSSRLQDDAARLDLVI